MLAFLKTMHQIGLIEIKGHWSFIDNAECIITVSFETMALNN